MQAKPFLSKLNDYVPGKSMDEVRAKYDLERVIKLASNENPLGPSPMALSAVMQTLTQSHLYPRGEAPELRAALARKYQLSPENFLVGNGSDEVIQYLSTVLLGAGDQVITYVPTFSEYRFNATVVGAETLEVALSDLNSIDLEPILAAITAQTKVIYLCSPNNPTGSWIRQDEMLQFLKAVPSSIVVVVDQAYGEYATDPQYPQLIDQIHNFPNLVLSRTFSKLYGLAGLRCGYAIAHPQLVSWMLKVKQPFNVNLLAQRAASAALFDMDHISRSLAINSQGLTYLCQNFNELGYEILDSQANFLAVRIGSQAAELVQWLERRGMILRHLKSFGLPEWIRVTIGLPSENEFLIQLINQWKKGA